MKKLICMFFAITLNMLSQSNPKIDSLNNALKIAKTDTGKLFTLNAVASELLGNKPDTGIYLSNQALAIAKRKKFNFGITESTVNIGIGSYYLGKNEEAILYLNKADSLSMNVENYISKSRKLKLLCKINNTLGAINLNLGNTSLAKKYFEKYLKISEDLGFDKGIGNAYINLAVITQINGNYPEALKNLFAALKKFEAINEKNLMANAYNNIAAIYMDQNDNQKALNYLEKTITIAKETNQLGVASVSYYNIGLIYYNQNINDKALLNAKEAYKIGLEIHSVQGITSALDLMGKILTKKGLYKEALEKHFEELKIADEAKTHFYMINALSSISNDYYQNNEIKNSIIYGERALEYARNLNSRSNIQAISESLALSYSAINNYKQAYEMKTLAINIRDSLLSNKNQKEIMGQEFKYEYDKKTLADSLNYINEKKISAISNQAKFKEEKNKQITLYIFLGLAIAIGAFVFNRFKVTQKQKSLIEAQSQRLEIAHSQLEIKSKEIKDSILYSKEIQNVFLKPLSENSAYFNDSLLVYKPKDVVSGDFYWYKEINDNLFIVIGDCTGHGVPGAIISVLAIQTLERLIGQLIDASKLHQLNELMNNEFKIYNSKNDLVNIGLDYSVMCLNKRTKQLYLSGSGSSTLIKNNNNDLIQEKFDSINIGGDLPFKYEPETKTYKISDVHAVFLYTDGIVDQRGGADKKRFSSGQLKELITNLNTNNSTIAYQKIESTLLAWQGSNVQMDDMTLFAIQFNNI